MLSGRRLPDGLVGIDLPRAYLEPIDPAVLADALGHVDEAYQAGPASVLAIVDDYETLCALSVDPMSLFLVPSSLDHCRLLRRSRRGRVHPRLRAATRPRGGSRHGQCAVRGRAMVGREGRLANRRGPSGEHPRRHHVRPSLRAKRRSGGHGEDILLGRDLSVSAGPLGPGERTRVRRLPKKAAYDEETIFAILDEAWVCHVAATVRGKPVALPTLHLREGRTIYLHGSPANEVLKSLVRDGRGLRDGHHL